jgi:superfamily I DNA/RNA helicase
MTCKAWQQDFLTQYGLTVNSTGDFEQMRQAYLSHIQQVVDRHQLSGVYDAILLDEAQDYLPAEIRLFSRLATRLFCVADERQKIYQGEDSIAELRKSLGEPQVLRFHYRNGINICRVADEVAKKLSGYKSLAQTCNYDEIANPSTVDYSQCDSIEEQARLILSRIGTQLATFPGQLLGILCPKRESMYAIWNAVKLSDHASAAFLLHGSSADTFPPHGRIVVSTFHAAKGLEFRALHLAACDELKSFKNNRRMTFTAVTRAKTALSVYHTGPIHPYFDAALRSLEPAPALPSLDDLFGGLR